MRLQFTGADLQVDGADAEGREIAVTLYLHATALLRQTQELTLLSDLYSTAYDLTYDAAPLELTSFREQFTRRQTVPGGAGDRCGGGFILALSVTCGAVSVSREGAGVVLRTGRLSGHCIWTRGACLWWRSGASTSAASWSCRRTAGSLPGPSAGRGPGQLTDRGIEVRFPVDFRAEAAQRVKRVVRVRRKDQYRRA